MTIPRIEPQPDGSIQVWIKTVPGASRDQIAGVLGDRIKIRVAAPPEGGKANAALCETLAGALGIKPRQVQIQSGHTHAEKTVRISGVSEEELLQFLAKCEP